MVNGGFMKILKYLKDNLLILGIVMLIVYLVLIQIITYTNYRFLSWFYLWSLWMIAFTIIAGWIQKIIKENIKKYKVLYMIYLIISCAIMFVSGYILMVFGILGYSPDYIVYKDGKKYVATVSNFIYSDITYYDYKNFIIKDISKPIFKEKYGIGYYNPFEKGNKTNAEIKEIIYYDENGNEIEKDNEEIENIINNIN